MVTSFLSSSGNIFKPSFTLSLQEYYESNPLAKNTIPHSFCKPFVLSPSINHAPLNAVFHLQPCYSPPQFIQASTSGSTRILRVLSECNSSNQQSSSCFEPMLTSSHCLAALLSSIHLLEGLRIEMQHRICVVQYGVTIDRVSSPLQLLAFLSIYE